MLSGTHENGSSDGRENLRFGPGAMGMEGVVAMIKGGGNAEQQEGERQTSLRKCSLTILLMQLGPNLG